MCKKSNNHQPTSIGKPSIETEDTFEDDGMVSIETEDTFEEDGMVGSGDERKLLNAVDSFKCFQLFTLSLY